MGSERSQVEKWICPGQLSERAGVEKIEGGGRLIGIDIRSLLKKNSPSMESSPAEATPESDHG